MKSRLILLLLSVPGTAAFAQYKCTAANGAITFQQAPCPSSQTEQKLVVVPNGHPVAAPGSASPKAASSAPAASAGSGDNVDKRMLANYERQQQREPLRKALESAQYFKEDRAGVHQEEVASAKRRFGDDPANAQALRDALAAIDGRYKALSDLDDRNIENARKALEAWDRTH